MKPFQTFGDLILISCVALVALVFATVPALSVTVIRPIIGVVFVLFVPGYAFIAALYPQKAVLAHGVRLGLSFGVSVAIVPLLEIILNYTRYGIRLAPTLIVMTLFVMGCSTVASVRRQRLPPGQRFTVNWQALRKSSEQQAAQTAGSPLDRMLSMVLVLAIIVSASIAIYAIVVPQQGEHFSEFYLLGANGTLGNYTTDYKVGVPSPITVGIVNHEARNVTYMLVVSANNSTQRSSIYSEQVTVPDGQLWEKQIDLVVNQPGDNVKLDFALYADSQTGAPYRDTHMWVNVTA